MHYRISFGIKRSSFTKIEPGKACTTGKFSYPMPAMDGKSSMDPLANKFYLLQDQRTPSPGKGKATSWDPWPVDGYRRRDDPVLKAARSFIRVRNHECLDNYIDRIVLLPASSTSISTFGRSSFQGGSEGMWLYSIRSPSTLPVRVILWQSPTRKLMVRCGTQSQSLKRFIASWAGAATAIEPDGFCKHYQFWKSVNVNEEWLSTIPTHLHPRVHERWWMVNGFCFLELPFELREMILAFAMETVIEPMGDHYRRRPNPLTALDVSTTPDLNLTLVNGQLHREATQVLYAYTTFFFRSPEQFDFFFYRWLGCYESNLFHSQQWIRSIEMHLNAHKLLRLFDVRASFSDGGPPIYIRSDTGKANNTIPSLAEQLSVKHICIRIPHVMEVLDSSTLPCQKMFCLAFWAGAREILCHIPAVEFVGYIEDTMKKEWMAELSLRRASIPADQDDPLEWHNQILPHW